MIDFTGVTALRIPEGDVTKVVRKSDGVVLWEKVTSRLPKEFQEVEYIHIPSGAYINTGFIPADDTTFYIKMQSYSGYSFGTGSNPRLASVINGTGIQVYNPLNSTSGISTIYSVNDLSIPEVVIEITTYTGTDYCQTWATGYDSGERYSDSGYVWPTNYTLPLYVGAMNYSTTNTRVAVTDVYAVRAQIGSTHYLDLVPAYRKADNVAGLYNLISGEFLTNAGSGTITIGPIIGIILVWKPGYCCEYAVGKSYTPFVSSSYTVSEAIAVEPGVTYKVNVQATAGSSFRFVGANSNGIVTETVNCPIVVGDNIFTFTPSSNTTQMRIRTYAGNENWTWKLSKA